MTRVFVICLLLVAAFSARADDAADRESIARTIAALNQVPLPSVIFTAEANISPEFEKLRKAGPVGATAPRIDHPTVTISKEPWGEASIDFPGMESSPVLELRNPRIVSNAIRLIAPDVALADGEWIYETGAGRQTRSLFFVLKREGDSWKIASVRVVALSSETGACVGRPIIKTTAEIQARALSAS